MQLPNFEEFNKESSDNRMLAILFMNVQAIFGCLSALTFKTVGKTGVSIWDYALCRSSFNFCMIFMCLQYWGLNPVRDFPKQPNN
jgi:hypothetical protein